MFSPSRLLPLMLFLVLVTPCRPTMATGDPAILRIQGALLEKGYNPGPVDGKMGERTARAIRAFQSSNSLTSSGVANKETLQALFTPPAESSGQVHQDSNPNARPECMDELIASPPQSERERDSLAKLWGSVEDAGDLTAQEDIDEAYDKIFSRASQMVKNWWRYNSSAPNSAGDAILNLLNAVETGDWKKYRLTFEQAAESSLPEHPPAPIRGLFSHIDVTVLAQDPQVVRVRLRGIWTPSAVEFPRLTGRSLEFCRDLVLVRAASSQSGSVFVQPVRVPGGVYHDWQSSKTGWLLAADQVHQIPFDFPKERVEAVVQ